MSPGEYQKSLDMAPVEPTREIVHYYLDGYSECDDDDLPPLEYARRHGLIEHQTQEKLLQATLVSLSSETTSIDLGNTAPPSNVEELQKIAAGEDHVLNEKWSVDKETVEYLAAVVAFEKYEDFEDNKDLPEFRSLKICEPVLSSDPEIDLWRLKQRNTPVIAFDVPDSTRTDEEFDDISNWLETKLVEASKTQEWIAKEKLDVNRDIAKYMNEVVSLGSLHGEAKPDEELSPLRYPSPETPTLLPLSPPLSPAGLSTSAGELEMTSTPNDLTAEEAACAKQRILDLDRSIGEANANADTHSVYSPLRTPATSSSSPLQKRKLQDFQVDVPILPQDSMSPIMKGCKTVSFPTELRTIIPSSDIDTVTSDLEDDVEVCIGNIVAPLSASAISKIENEQLAELDTTMRVSVPDLEEREIRQNPRQTGNDETMLQSILESCFASNDKKWSGVSKVERVLPWSPFPACLAKVPIDDSFDDGSLARYMAEIDSADHIDTDGFVWKPDGLRILDQYDSDDEQLESMQDQKADQSYSDRELGLERRSPPAPPPRSNVNPNKAEAKQPLSSKVDMQTLLRKRKLELEDTNEFKGLSKQPKQSSMEVEKRQKQTFHWSGRNGPTNASGLSGFMRLHGEIMHVAQGLKDQQVLTHKEVGPTAKTVTSRLQDQSELEVLDLPLAVPQVPDLEKHTSVVLSSELIADRQLIREIESILPRLDMVERDPIAPLNANESKSLKEGSRYDADMTISPAVGLIFTTLQKLKQKPLPGQSTSFGIRERIQHVAIRYEHLIVLVNKGREGLERDLAFTSPFDESNSEALSEFIAFGARLSTDLAVYYVAGGERELARWTAAFVCRYSVSASDMKVIHEETLWERLLRYTGLNAFAAQGILRQLKLSEEINLSEGSSSTLSDYESHGLAAFIRMAPDQRVRRFGAMMGGDRVLKRVNAVIDTRWISASARGQ